MSHGFSISTPIDYRLAAQLIADLSRAKDEAVLLGLWYDGAPAADHFKAIIEYLSNLNGAETRSEKCPQCRGQDEFCTLCNGSKSVSPSQADEWRRQNA